MKSAHHSRKTSIHCHPMLSTVGVYPNAKSASRIAGISTLADVTSLDKNGARQLSKISGKPEQCSEEPKKPFLTTIGHANKQKLREKKLSSFSNLSLPEGLYLVNSLAKQFCLQETHKIDCQFNIQQCWIGVGGELKITTSPKTSTNILHSKLSQSASKQTKTSVAIVQSVYKVCGVNFQDFYSYFSRSLSKNGECTIRQLLAMIKSYSQCTKIPVAQKVTFQHNRTQSQLKSYQEMHSGIQSRNKYLKTETDVNPIKSWSSNKVLMTESIDCVGPKANLVSRPDSSAPKFLRQRKSSMRSSGDPLEANRLEASAVNHFNYFDDYCTETNNQQSSPKTVAEIKRSSDNVKYSMTSTNRTSSHYGSSNNKSFQDTCLFTFEGGKTNWRHNHGLLSPKRSKDQMLSFLSNHLEEVQSLGGNSDRTDSFYLQKIVESSTEFNREDSEHKNGVQMFEEQFLKNCWTVKFGDLLSRESIELKESLVIGKEVQQNLPEVQKLGKLARVIHDSITPADMMAKRY